MCQNCDSPEARAQITEIAEAVGLGDLAPRVMLHRFSTTSTDPDRFVSPARYGEAVLTVGQANVIISGLIMQIDKFLGEGEQALAMSRMLGVPMDALVDGEAARSLVVSLLDALDAVNAAAASEVEFSIPDDASSLVDEF